LAVTLGVMFALRGGPRVVQQIVYVPVAAQPREEFPVEPRGDLPAAAPAGAGHDVPYSPDSFFALRRRVFERGAEALFDAPAADEGGPPSPASPPGQRQLLEQWLHG